MDGREIRIVIQTKPRGC